MRLQKPAMEFTLAELKGTLHEHGLGESQLVLNAIKQAQDSHRNAVRKEGGSYLTKHIYPVVSHALSTARDLGFSQSELEKVAVAAAIHDVLEDDPGLTPEDIREKFGDDVYSIVMPLVKKRWDEYQGNSSEDRRKQRDSEYMEGLHSAALASIVIKFADRCNNILSLRKITEKEWAAEYVLETREHYLPLFKKRLPSHVHLLEMLVSQHEEPH